MYSHGQGVPQDYIEAAKWYRLAAEQGHADAQHNLGVLYLQGQGVPQDYVLAHMWVNLAAANATKSDTPEISSTDLRDSIARQMTAQQIAEAQDLARKCTVNKFKGC